MDEKSNSPGGSCSSTDMYRHPKVIWALSSLVTQMFCSSSIHSNSTVCRALNAKVAIFLYTEPFIYKVTKTTYFPRLFHKDGFLIVPKWCSYFSLKDISKPLALICENLHYTNDYWHEETTCGHPLYVLL